MIETIVILAVAIWLIRIGRVIQRIDKGGTPPPTTHRDRVTGCKIGRN